MRACSPFHVLALRRNIPLHLAQYHNDNRLATEVRRKTSFPSRAAGLSAAPLEHDTGLITHLSMIGQYPGPFPFS
jgi:hypothetical protein